VESKAVTADQNDSSDDEYSDASRDGPLLSTAHGTAGTDTISARTRGGKKKNKVQN